MLRRQILSVGHFSMAYSSLFKTVSGTFQWPQLKHACLAASSHRAVRSRLISLSRLVSPFRLVYPKMDHFTQRDGKSFLTI